MIFFRAEVEDRAQRYSYFNRLFVSADGDVILTSRVSKQVDKPMDETQSGRGDIEGEMKID
jgi:hypothetical protein